MQNKTDETQPLITCIVLTYKKFNTIFTTLDSVLTQSYSNIELLITDDGSPNIPQQNIKNYIIEHKSENIKNFKILTSAENQGTVKNLNKAIKAAQGKYCIQLAGDDCFYETSTIEKIISRMEQNDWNVMIGRRILCDSNLKNLKMIPSDKEIKKINEVNTVDKQKIAFATGRYYNMASGSVFYYKTDFIKEMGLYDEQYILWEDGPMFYNILHNGHILHLAYDLITIFYKDGGISTSTVKHPLLVKDNTKFIENIDMTEYVHCGRKTKRLIHHLKKSIHINRSNFFSFLWYLVSDFDIILYNKLIMKIL